MIVFFSASKTIHDFVRANDVKQLELIVGRGASVNEVDLRTDDKFTPLHWAAHAGSLEVGNDLLINSLMFFSFSYEKCMHWLLWQSADMDAQTPKGWTPGHIASIRGHDPCIQVGEFRRSFFEIVSLGFD